MLVYMKFMKDILSNKRKPKGIKTIALNNECSVILLKKLPLKLKDPRSFYIAYTNGKYKFEKA